MSIKQATTEGNEMNTLTTAAPAGYVSQLATGVDAYGQAWEREDYVPAAGTYAPAPASSTVALAELPTGCPLAVAVSLADDTEGVMSFAFNLEGEAHGVAEATYARELSAVPSDYVVALISGGVVVRSARGEA